MQLRAVDEASGGGSGAGRVPEDDVRPARAGHELERPAACDGVNRLSTAFAGNTWGNTDHRRQACDQRQCLSPSQLPCVFHTDSRPPPTTAGHPASNSRSRARHGLEPVTVEQGRHVEIACQLTTSNLVQPYSETLSGAPAAGGKVSQRGTHCGDGHGGNGVKDRTSARTSQDENTRRCQSGQQPAISSQMRCLKGLAAASP